MKSSSIKKAKLIEKIIIYLDILLAILIITLSSSLVKTQFGKASIIFGFIMIAITTLTRILQKI